MPWERWEFRPRRLPLITSEVAVDLLEALGRGRPTVTTSLDLWVSRVALELTAEGARIGPLLVRREELEEVAEDERTVFAATADGLVPVEARAGRYYKLVNCGRGRAPTLEVDGIHMHRVAGVSPTEDASSKVGRLGALKGRTVLDTCTGLGYTAVEALRRGAARVVTVEVDPNVLSIAELNPWSEGLSSGSSELILGDVAEVVRNLPSAHFDAVIHDPPRFSLAGELYSEEFYRELARVLRPGGRIVHYVGHPGSRSGKRVHVGVMRRMRASGFVVRWVGEMGVVVGRRAP
ncbi:MAG: RsmD family RNA methyltransferase [Candidatus Caldarchaeales archaeon]